MLLRRTAAEPIRHPGEVLLEFAGEKNCGAAGPYERQTPLERYRWRSERLGHYDTEGVDFLLFGATADDPQVWKVALELLEKAALSSLRLDQRDRALGECSCQRYPRRSSARADVCDRALESLDEAALPAGCR